MMRKVVIAFDVDGTLRCNCTETCSDINRRVVDLLLIIKHMKNTRIMIWSGRGTEWAREVMGKFEAAKGCHFAAKWDESTWKWGKPDIAIDDQQACELGTINLIVREK